MFFILSGHRASNIQHHFLKLGELLLSIATCCWTHVCTQEDVYAHVLWKLMHLSSLLTCSSRSITQGGGWMNASPRQRPPTVAEHIVRMYSLWPESFPRWINHDKAYQPYAGFLFYLLSCPSSEYALEKLQKKTGEGKKKKTSTHHRRR